MISEIDRVTGVTFLIHRAEVLTDAIPDEPDRVLGWELTVE